MNAEPIKAEIKPLSKDRVRAGAGIPKYLQVQRILMDYMVSLPPEVEFLPYEDELAQRLGVSRRTIRRAMEELRAAGLVQTVRKSGSRILRGPLTAAEAVLPEHCRTSIGVVVSSDQEDDHRAGQDLRWRLIQALENRLLPRECAVVLYNIRENSFRKWQNAEQLIASLREKGIRFVVMVNESSLLRPGVLPELLAAGIKPVLFTRDSDRSLESLAQMECGVDFVQVNHLPLLRRCLKEYFLPCDFIGFLVNEANLYWAGRRAAVVRWAAAAEGIPFELFTEPEPAVPNPTNAPRFSLELTRRLWEQARNAAHPLCFAANDQIAELLLRHLQTLGVSVPQQLRVVGYDNDFQLRDRNLSTFDVDLNMAVECVVELYAEFLSDPERSFLRSRGRMVGTRYLKRGSA